MIIEAQTVTVTVRVSESLTRDSDTETVNQPGPCSVWHELLRQRLSGCRLRSAESLTRKMAPAGYPE